MKAFITKIMTTYQIFLLYCYTSPEKASDSISRILFSDSLTLWATLFILNAWLHTGRFLFRRCPP